MWEIFFLTALCALVLTYLPGFLINRALRFDALLSFVMAPAVSYFCVILIGLICFCIPIRIGGIAIFLILVAISVAALVVSAVRSRSQWEVSTVSNASLLTKLPRSMTKFSMMGIQNKASNWLILALYVLVALAITLYMILGNIENASFLPAAFFQTEAFVSVFNLGQMDIFSIVSFSVSPESGEWAFEGHSLWQVLVALIANITKANVAICSTALLSVVLIFVIPFGIFGLLSILFNKSRLLIISGSVFALSFAPFPWHMLLSYEQLSICMAVAFVPYAFVAVLGLTIQGSKIQSKAVYSALLLAVFVSMLFAYPNIFLSVLVLGAPYLVSRYFCWVNDFGKFKKPVLAKVFGAFSYICVCFLIWMVFCDLPSTMAQPGYTAYFDDLATALGSVCTLTLIPSAGSQIFLGVMILLGALSLLFKKGFRWLVATWVMSVLMFLFFALIPVETLRYVCGFWYLDANIVSSLVCIASIPLAASFITVIIRGISGAFCSFIGIGNTKASLSIVGCVIFALFLVFNSSIHEIVFADDSSYRNSLTTIRSEIDKTYTISDELLVIGDSTL